MSTITEKSLAADSIQIARPVNMLCIGKNPGYALKLQELTAGHSGCSVKIEWAESLFTRLENTASDDYDILLLDISMQDRYGLQALYEVREHLPELPVIVLTDLDDEDYAVQVLQTGAQDYLIKGHIDYSLFIHSVHNAIERQRIITKLEQTRKIERYLAYHDTLTKLPNRQLFFDRLVQSVAHARRSKACLAVLFLDLDGFKKINDTLGHSTGDLLLLATAERLANCIRESETVARFGGDEFTVILSEIAHERDAAIVAQRILESVNSPFILAEHECCINTSIGISIFPSDGMDAKSLIKNADTAMYQAKSAGGHTYRFYTPVMNTDLLEHPVHEKNIKRALERNEFLLHYQPQLSLASGKIISVEALVRWDHPEIGILSPEQFIPIAEKTGLIVQIGEYVLNEACAQTRQWQKAGISPVRVAVNLSARQLQQKNLIHTISTILDKTKLNPEMLGLEISESSTINKGDHTIETLRTLKSMGIQLSIDDFGTGYSSLSHLKCLPIELLKIDRSFVLNITSKPEDRAINKAIIAMAHSLGLKVVAEGVETEEQLDVLHSLKCDIVQGYYFSHPVPAETITNLLIKKQDSRTPLWKHFLPSP